MKPVYQTIDTKEYGNCLEACLASILGDDINNYPKIASGAKWPLWINPINKYLIEYHRCYLLCLDTESPKDDFRGYYIVVGDNATATHSHAMIGLNGEIVFDPSGTNRKYETYKYIILVSYFTDEA